MPEYDRKTLETAIGIITRLEESQRAGAARCVALRDFVGAALYGHGDLICGQIIRLLKDLADE